MGRLRIWVRKEGQSKRLRSRLRGRYEFFFLKFLNFLKFRILHFYFFQISTQFPHTHFRSKKHTHISGQNFVNIFRPEMCVSKLFQNIEKKHKKQIIQKGSKRRNVCPSPQEEKNDCVRFFQAETKSCR